MKNPEHAPAQEALEELQAIFHVAKRVVSEAGRIPKRHRMEKRYMTLVKKYADDPVLEKYMKKLGRALPDAFVFVEDPSIPPTNNYAERAIRKPVVHRKVRGYIKSEKSMVWIGYLFSCAATWKNQGLDFREQILQYV